MRRIAMLAGVVLAALPATAQAAPITFADPVQLSPASGFAIAAVPLNGDAAADVMITPGATGTALQTVLNQGNGAFFGPADVPGAGQVERPAFGDVDGDGDIDAAISSSGGLILLRNNGQGGFTTSLEGPATFVSDAAIGDVTGDGRPDLVATTFSNEMTATSLQVLRQENDGSFNDTPIPQGLAGNAGQGPRAMWLTDVTGDGRLDALTADNLGIVFVLPGNGTGNFATRMPFNVTTQAFDLYVVDLDNDGIQDVVTASKAANSSVNILKGVAGGTFGPAIPLAVGLNAEFVAIGDLDGDGIRDLAVGNAPTAQEARVSILRGHGDLTFDAAIQIPVGTGPNAPGVAIGDGNQDDRPDLFVAPRTSGPVVFFNTTTFPPPSVSTGAASGATLDAATVAGSVDTDGRRGFFHFEFGETTNYGTSTPEQALTTSADAQAVSAALTGLKPSTTYHFRLVGRTLAGGTVAGADATFTTLSTVSFTKASFNVKFTLSKSRGTLVVRGSSPLDADVTFTLLRQSGKQLRGVRAYKVKLKPGDFVRQLTVPATLLPGKYVVRANGVTGGQPFTAPQLAVTLAAPPEGVVRQAFASAFRNGPPALRLPGRRTAIHFTFLFANKPKRGPVVVTLFAPGGRKLGSATKPIATRVEAGASSRAGLTPGTWRCELKVRGKLLAVTRVRIG